MKKTNLSALLLTLCCGLSLVACDSPSSEPTSEPESNPTSEPESSGPIVLDEKPEPPTFTTFEEGTGTQESPYNATQALSQTKLIANGQASEAKYYYTGIVTGTLQDSKGAHFTISNGTDSILVFQLIKEVVGEETTYYEIDDDDFPQKNDVVVLCSNAKNFYGTYELINNELVSLVEGEHESETKTALPELSTITWIGSTDNLYSGTYIIGGKQGTTTYLLSSTLSSKKILSSEYSTGLYKEDYLYYVTVKEDGKVSLYNLDCYKYLAWTGSKTDVTWSTEEYLWTVSNVNGQIRFADPTGARYLRLNSENHKWGTYAASTFEQNSCSDLLFYYAK